MAYRPWSDIVGGGVSPPENLHPVSPTPVPAPQPIVIDNKRGVLERHSNLIASGILGTAVVIGGWLLNRNKAPDVPTPNPTPAVVVDAQLSKLLPNDTARSQVASYFRDVSYFVERAQNLKTTGQVIQAVQSASQCLQQANGLTGLAAINQPISDRIIRAVGGQPTTGMPDIPLDQPLASGAIPRQVLAREYAQISTDVRG